jgi:penicillin-binding protein 2
MHEDWTLLELKTKDDVFTAQIEFANARDVSITAESSREYPYNSIAAQTIGWVSLASGQTDKHLFKGDKLRSYLSGEVCGREDGVEYVCETVLRGRRGEMFYNIDGEPTKIETQLGQDVQITLDIELQKKIEQYLTDCNQNENYQKPMAAVVIDVKTGDVLSMVSLPRFNLNEIRQEYDRIASDPNEPIRNRAINKQYPPGSAIKPLILIAGFESGKITDDEAIACTSMRPPKGWPRCWVQKKYGRIGHSDWWHNSASNAIKGSCNIYFSQMAERINSRILQKWFYNFGYGKKIIFPFDGLAKKLERNFNQVHGQISDVFVSPSEKIQDFSDIPLLSKESERRWFGIGQGNLRASPLQVANSMAAIARRGVFKNPRLFVNQQNTLVPLEISPRTLDVIWNGMRAVVNEYHGTAYSQFSNADFDRYGVKVYGKTGSTERPAHAWFAGFAEGEKNRSIAFSVLVEGGSGGADDAAPLARQIIQFCIDAGYIGSDSVQ